MALRTLLIFTTFFSINVKAENTSGVDCTKTFSTRDVEQCLTIELDKTETNLNLAYQSLVKQLTQTDTSQDNYTEHRRKLLIAQRAWIKFREADCGTQYTMHGSKSIRNAIYLSCKKERAEQRIKELSNYAPY